MESEGGKKGGREGRLFQNKCTLLFVDKKPNLTIIATVTDYKHKKRLDQCS